MKKILTLWIGLEDLLMHLNAPYLDNYVFTTRLKRASALFTLEEDDLAARVGTGQSINEIVHTAACLPRDRALLGAHRARIEALWKAEGIEPYNPHDTGPRDGNVIPFTYLAGMLKREWDLDYSTYAGDSNDWATWSGRIGIAPRVHGGTGVIEFRAHEGTLDPGHILLWTRVCSSIVEKALLPDREYRTFLEGILGKIGPNARQQHTVMDVLADLGISEHDRRCYRDKMRAHERWAVQYEERTTTPWVPYGESVFVPPLEGSGAAPQWEFPMDWP
jgi:hypothetical protein